MTTDKQLEFSEQQMMEDLEFQERHQQLQDQEMSESYSELHQLIPVIDIWELQPSPATSEQIANGIIEAIKEGKINPLDFAVKRKTIVDALDLAFKHPEVKDMTVSEVEKFGKAGASCLGATITCVAKRTYHYDDDPTWRAIKADMRAQEEALKAQELRIQTACKNNCSLISEDGEIIASIVPAPATETISVSFKQKK